MLFACAVCMAGCPPKSIVTASFAAKPAPLIFTMLPTVPTGGVT